MTRRDYIIRRTPLSRPQFRLLNALVRGTPIGDAIRRAAPSFDGSNDEFAKSLRNWFADWAAAGFFAAVIQAKPTASSVRPASS